MLFVPPGGVANHTDGLVVHFAEKLELLPVKRAHLARVTVQLPRRSPQTLALLHVRLAQVLQGEAGYGIIHGLGSAQGAVAAPSVPPVLLQTGRTEAVAALEDHRVSEDVAAYGTGQVYFWEPGCHPDTSAPVSLWKIDGG